MGDNRSDLPEGTDEIIDTDATEILPEDVDTTTSGASTGTPPTVSANTRGPTADAATGGAPDLRQRLRDGSEKLSSQAGERARGLVTQGLERSAEALSNVSRLVGDTAAGLDERLGEEYGEYARRAAAAIENTANSIASKDPDELIEDTRNFVRNSPGVAIAGAAIVGFAVARLLKSGLGGRDEDDDEA
jgi:ElaB/YqjD/DUF883 family membrane-anchored ribosome-binding protein